jgi:hypothetical protein
MTVIPAKQIIGEQPAITNKGMVASVTVSDFDIACATAVAGIPNGYVGINVNGVAQSVGNGVRTQSCYFSGDGGATARAYGAVVATDHAYWVGSVALFQLAVTDVIDFIYNG